MRTLESFSKSLFVYFLLLNCHLLQGQVTNLVQAKKYLNQGDHLEAMQLIYEATGQVETEKRADTWYYKGLIYEGIYLSRDKKEGYNNVSNPLLVAADSYKKALDLKPEASIKDDLSKRYERIANLLFQEGVNRYNNKEYLNSSRYFTYCEYIKANHGEVDSLAIFNQGLAYEQSRMFYEAIKAYERTADIGYSPESSYSNIVFIYTSKLGNDEKALEVLKKARSLYPGHYDLLTSEINLLLKYSRFDEALASLNFAIQNGYESKHLYYARGTIQSQREEYTKAYSDYTKAIEMDSLYFDALYNLGALLFNIGADMNNAANDLTDMAAAQKAKKEADLQFTKAIPYLEKAHQVNPNDQSTMQSLMMLYQRTSQSTKYKAIKKKLEDN